MTEHRLVVDHIDGDVIVGAGCICGWYLDAVTPRTPAECARAAIRHQLNPDGEEKPHTPS